MTYISDILANYATGLIGLYPMDETSGTNMDDKSAEANDGVFTGVTLNSAASPWDGTNAPSFDGVNDHAKFLSAGFDADFAASGQYTVMAWAKVSGVGVWTDGAERCVLRMSVDVNNRIQMRKDTTNGQIRYIITDGGTLKQITQSGHSETDWMHFAITHDKVGDVAKCWFNGVQVGANQTGLGTFTGTLTLGEFGAGSASGGTPWSGFMSYGAIWNVALADADIVNLYDGTFPGGGGLSIPAAMYNYRRRRAG